MIIFASKHVQIYTYKIIEIDIIIFVYRNCTNTVNTDENALERYSLLDERIVSSSERMNYLV